MSTTRRLFKNTLANVSAHVLTAGIAFITLPIMMNIFGQAYYGVFALVNSVVAFVALFDLGITTILIKQIAQVDPETDPDGLTNIIRLGRRWLFVVGTISTLLLIAVGYTPGLFGTLKADEAHLLRMMLLLYAAVQLIVWPAKIGHITLAGRQRYDAIALSNALVAIANACAIVLVLFLNRGPLVLTACFVAISTTASLALAFYARRLNQQEPSTTTNPLPFRQLSKQLLRLSLPIFIMQVAVFAVQQQIDRVVLGVMIGATAIAFYEVAAKLGTLLFQSTGLLISALPPFVAQKETITTRDGMNDFFVTGSRFLSLLLIPVYTTVFAFAPSIIRVWMGPDFNASILAAQLLIACALPYPLFVLIDSILVARDQFKIWVPFAITVAVVNLAVSIMLVSRIGFVGAAVGTLAATIVEVACYLWVMRTKLHCSLRIWFRSAAAPAAITAAFNALLAFTLLSLVGTTLSLPLLLICFVFVIASGFGLIFFGILSATERSATLQALKAVRRPS